MRNHGISSCVMVRDCIKCRFGVGSRTCLILMSWVDRDRLAQSDQLPGVEVRRVDVGSRMEVPRVHIARWVEILPLRRLKECPVGGVDNIGTRRLRSAEENTHQCGYTANETCSCFDNCRKAVFRLVLSVSSRALSKAPSSEQLSIRL